MRWPRARRLLRWSLVAITILVACGLLMRAVGFNVRLGQPPEFGWTAYPTMVVHRAEPGGSLPPGKLPPRRSQEVALGALVTWADGTKTLYIHR